ncbi:MAG: OmpA family protein [Burkholderiales bacterium]|nr:OmpA family protein [Burkholderiales bacterium]
MKKLLAILIAGSGLVACSSNKAPVQAPVTPAPVEAPQANTATDSLSGDNNSVYFGFDKYDIQDQYTGVVKSNANYLAATSTAKVQVQGNTDDIGSVEYNLSLGQKRADAVKKSLIASGAAKSQVEATSNGKLHAKFDNDTEENRALNRRADVLYKNEQPQGYTVDAKGLPVYTAVEGSK